MGTYITKSNIEAIYGVDNVATWSNLDNDDAAANDARIDSAIAYAEKYVEDRFRDSRYALPLVGNSSTALLVLKDVMAKLAGAWLYETRGIDETSTVAAKLIVHKNEADQMINRYLEGSMKLDAALVETGPTAPVGVR